MFFWFKWEQDNLLLNLLTFTFWPNVGFLKTFQHSWILFILRRWNPKTGCFESPQWTCTKGRRGRIYSLYAIFGKALWKEISQFHRKSACHKTFLLLLKIFQSTTYPTAHILCISRPKRVPVKKIQTDSLIFEHQTTWVPNLHKKRRMNEKKSTLVEL